MATRGQLKPSEEVWNLIFDADARTWSSTEQVHHTVTKTLMKHGRTCYARDGLRALSNAELHTIDTATQEQMAHTCMRHAREPVQHTMGMRCCRLDIHR